MRRVFYFNILYRCNQDCLFCFSHNTKTEFSGSEISLDVFNECLRRNEVGVSDRVVINGGEPTLHKGLLEIIKLAVATGAETVLYTNGVAMADETLARLICDAKIDRITVPIHGSALLHDKITGVPDSYNQALIGIKNIGNYAETSLFELKFIVTNEMATSGFSCRSFFDKHLFPDSTSSVVITGQVNTRVANSNDYQCMQTHEYLRFAEQQIKDFSGLLPVKFYDFEMCGFSDKFLKWFDALETKENNVDYRYFFSDEKSSRLKELSYSSMRSTHKCLNCERRIYCRSIVDGYLVTDINDGHKKLEME